MWYNTPWQTSQKAVNHRMIFDVTGAGLAPMAGVTDKSMRELCAQFGAAFTVSEMVSAKALTMQDKKSRQLLRGGGGKAPYGVQLFGAQPSVFAQAIALLEDEEFDFLDLNFGCPAPKICQNGAGSALLKNLPLAGQIAQEAVRASRRPVSAKMRIGWDEDTSQSIELAKRCEDAGVVMLCVHARTQKQQYSPGLNYEAVAAIKAAVGLPVLFNGDVDSPAAAQNALQKTGCDGVVVGRAAVGNPFLFAQMRAVLSGAFLPKPPGLHTVLSVMEKQVRGMCQEKGEERAMREARKVCAAYMRGLKGAAVLRNACHSLTYFTDMQSLVNLVYQNGNI